VKGALQVLMDRRPIGDGDLPINARHHQPAGLARRSFRARRGNRGRRPLLLIMPRE
jgi:hypothetical protein